MSIWIRAVCRRRAAFSADELREGVAERLDLLTALYCPRDEEPAEAVVARLRVDPLGPDTWTLHYREDRFIRAERWSGARAEAEARELAERIDGPAEPGAAAVRSLLGAATDIVAFELKASDADGMGWPICIAAAAWIAARGDGLVNAEGEGWLEPTPKEVRPVLRER
jgi:hypothetical protein